MCDMHPNSLPIKNRIYFSLCLCVFISVRKNKSNKPQYLFISKTSLNIAYYASFEMNCLCEPILFTVRSQIEETKDRWFEFQANTNSIDMKQI